VSPEPQSRERPTDEQRRVIGPSDDGVEREFCVHACPGSGKTTAVAERFVQLATGRTGRAGVAVLSFSNVAAGEVSRRCQLLGTPGIVGHPNFVGTVDAFVWRYFVGLFSNPWSALRPQLLDAWARLGLAVRPRGVGRTPAGLTLDELVIGANGVRLDIELVDRRIRAAVARNIAAWEREAIRRKDGLLRQGWMSCADARHYALQRMLHPAEGPALARALRARFAEIIVDEAQDCNALDWKLVRWLRKAGIRLVIVGDPDQAIYEFRDADPVIFRDLACEMEVRPLTANFRSTSRICAVSATARGEATPDRASGRRAQAEVPVVLLPYEGRSVPEQLGQWFWTRCERHGIAPEEAAVLAHGTRHAGRAAGHVAPEERLSGSRAASLAQAAVDLRSEKDPRKRLVSLEVGERVILHRLGLDADHYPPESVAESAGISPRWLRRAALGVLCRLPEPPECKEAVGAWVEAVRAVLEGMQAPPGRPWLRKPGRVLPRPPQWAGCRSLPVRCLHATTVHRAKGMEFEAVLFVIPPHSVHSPSEDLLRDWQARTDSEPKRVAYVALTRAKLLLVIAVPVTLADHLASILTASGAEFERAVAVPAAVARAGSGLGRPSRRRA